MSYDNSDEFNNFLNAKSDDVDKLLNKKQKVSFNGQPSNAQNFDTFGTKRANNGGGSSNPQGFNSNYGYGNEGYGDADDYGYGYGTGTGTGYGDQGDDVEVDPYAFDIDLDNMKAPSENELGKYSASELSEFNSKERDLNKSSEKFDTKSVESGTGYKDRDRETANKKLNPIIEDDEYIDPRNMDKVKAVSFFNPQRDLELSQDKSEDKYSDTFEKFSDTYKSRKMENNLQSQSLSNHNNINNKDPSVSKSWESNTKDSKEFKDQNNIRVEKVYESRDKDKDKDQNHYRSNYDLSQQKVENTNLQLGLNQAQSSSFKVASELQEIKQQLHQNRSTLDTKDKTVEECKNQLTKANELIHQYRLALEDAYKQIDGIENVNKILKDEIGFLKGELEQTSKFNHTRDKDIDFLEAERRELDAERKYSQIISDKDRKLAHVQQDLEKYKTKVLDMERKNKEYVEKVTNYEGSLNKLNKEYEQLEKDRKLPADQDKLKKLKTELELGKEVQSLEALIKGYQRENEILTSKEQLNKKEVEQLSAELKEEFKRNSQLQQQLLRTNNQALVSNETIDLNKSSINNLIIGGETISIHDLKELKHKNKFLNENLTKTINDNKHKSEKEAELSEMVSNYKYKVEELELKLEGIDVDKFKRENDVLSKMAQDYNLKESKMNDRIRDLEGKLKFYVETQELIDKKNDKIKALEEKLHKTMNNPTNTLADAEEKKGKGKENIPVSTSGSKFSNKKDNKSDVDDKIKLTVLKEQNLILQKKVDDLSKSLEDSEQNYVDKIRQLRQENNIRNMAVFENENSANTPSNSANSLSDDVSGRELVINYCAMLKDIAHLQTLLTVDGVESIPAELTRLGLNYDVNALRSVKTFVTKVGAQCKDLNDFNKVSRIQRIKVVVNKYQIMLEQKIKSLLYEGQDRISDMDFTKGCEEKSIGTDLVENKEDLYQQQYPNHQNQWNANNTYNLGTGIGNDSQLLNTHNSSIATTLLQGKIEQLEREKMNFLNHNQMKDNHNQMRDNNYNRVQNQNFMPQSGSQSVHQIPNSNSWAQANSNPRSIENTQQLMQQNYPGTNERSEIKEINEYRHNHFLPGNNQANLSTKPSFMSQLPDSLYNQDLQSQSQNPSYAHNTHPTANADRDKDSSLNAKTVDARVEYLEAFNYELSLQLKQTIIDKNKLEEKVYEHELEQFRSGSSKLDSLQLEKLVHRVESMEQRHQLELQELTQNFTTQLYTKEKDLTQAVSAANKDNRRLKDLLKTKQEEMQEMKHHLEEIEDDLRKLR